LPRKSSKRNDGDPPREADLSFASLLKPSDFVDRPQTHSIARSFQGSELLAGDSPAAILDRIARGDPLGIEARCKRHSSENALLLDSERLITRALAHTARRAVGYRGEPPLDSWLADRIEDAAAELLSEDVEAVRNQDPIDRSDLRYRFLADALGVDAHVALRATAAFNDLPPDVRRDFWAVVREGKTIQATVTASGRARAAVARNVKRGILTISLLRDPGPSPDGGGA